MRNLLILFVAMFISCSTVTKEYALGEVKEVVSEFSDENNKFDASIEADTLLVQMISVDSSMKDNPFAQFGGKIIIGFSNKLIASIESGNFNPKQTNELLDIEKMEKGLSKLTALQTAGFHSIKLQYKDINGDVSSSNALSLETLEKTFDISEEATN